MRIILLFILAFTSSIHALTVDSQMPAQRTASPYQKLFPYSNLSVTLNPILLKYVLEKYGSYLTLLVKSYVALGSQKDKPTPGITQAEYNTAAHSDYSPIYGDSHSLRNAVNALLAGVSISNKSDLGRDFSDKLHASLRELALMFNYLLSESDRSWLKCYN